MNNVSMIGRVTRDLELRYTPSGKAVTKFSIAVNEGYGDKKIVYFFNIEAWNKTAENCDKYIGKGSLIAVSGSLKQHNWEDKSGNKRYDVLVLANRVEFLDSKPKQSAESEEGFDLQ